MSGRREIAPLVGLAHNLSFLHMRHLIGATALLLGLLASPAMAAELLPNGDLSIIGLNGEPVGWHRGGFGSINKSFSVAYEDGARSIKASSFGLGSGNAKWYHDDVPVVPGQSLTFSHRYDGNGGTITARYLIAGAYKYVTLNELGDAPYSDTFGFVPFRRTFTVPPGATAVSVWHSLSGSEESFEFADTTAFSLKDAVPFAPQRGQDLIRNADLAEVDQNGRLAYWTNAVSGGAKGRATLELCSVTSTAENEKCPPLADRRILKIELASSDNPTGAVSWGSQAAPLASGKGRRLDLQYAVFGPFGVKVQLQYGLADGTTKWAESSSSSAGYAWRNDASTIPVPDDATTVRVWFSQTYAMAAPGVPSLVGAVRMAQK